MDIKITKREKILEICNDMCWNFYYLVHGKLINDEGTKYKRFRFVVWFNAFDVQEFFDKDHFTKSDVSEYLNVLIDAQLSNINSYDDCKYFYELCRESIENFNERHYYN